MNCSRAEGPHACTCGGAGAPCPACNNGSPPKLPPGFKIDLEADE